MTMSDRAENFIPKLKCSKCSDVAEGMLFLCQGCDLAYVVTYRCECMKCLTWVGHKTPNINFSARNNWLYY
ncbi:MAG: hypothetical protein HFJ54_06285 [Clostridia bacterium]|nr:hypothetical protein [Clostridia bacterium]